MQTELRVAVSLVVQCKSGTVSGSVVGKEKGKENLGVSGGVSGGSVSGVSGSGSGSHSGGSSGSNSGSQDITDTMFYTVPYIKDGYTVSYRQLGEEIYVGSVYIRLYMKQPMFRLSNRCVAHQ